MKLSLFCQFQKPKKMTEENPNQALFDAISRDELTPEMAREALEKKKLFTVNDKVSFRFKLFLNFTFFSLNIFLIFSFFR